MNSLVLSPLLATEAGEEAGGISLLLPATAELIWGIVAFALLMLFFYRWVFPRVGPLLDQRAAQIQGQLEQAEATRMEAEELRRQYERQLANAQARADEVIEEARKQGERVRQDIVSRAEEEAAQIVARANDEADATRARLIGDLRNQVALASVELAGKILQRELDAEQHRALVDQYINELSGLN